MNRNPLFKAVLLSVAYALWTVGIQALVLTWLTYFTSTQGGKIQEIHETFDSHAILIAAFGAMSFLGLFIAFRPLTSTPNRELFDIARIRSRFLPGVVRGVGFSIAIVAAFILSGSHQYLGIFAQSEDAVLTSLNLVLRVFAIAGLVYCEEFVFRSKILRTLLSRLSAPTAILATSIVFTACKSLQFDLGLSQSLTHFLMGTLLGLRAHLAGDSIRGAGFWTGLLVSLHVGFGLPLFGNEVAGMFQISLVGDSEGLPVIERLLTGGIGGPLSSLAIQLLLTFDLVAILLKNRKELFPVEASNSK